MRKINAVLYDGVDGVDVLTVCAVRWCVAVWWWSGALVVCGGAWCSGVVVYGTWVGGGVVVWWQRCGGCVGGVVW